MNHPVAEFLKLLPDVNAPEIALEEDGDLCFDWWGRDGGSFSASLREDGNVSWSGLWNGGTEKATGHFILTGDGLPRDFVKALKEFEVGR